MLFGIKISTMKTNVIKAPKGSYHMTDGCALFARQEFLKTPLSALIAGAIKKLKDHGTYCRCTVTLYISKMPEPNIESIDQ